MKYVYCSDCSGRVIYTRRFITIHSSSHVILRLLPQKLESFSVGITDWKDSRSSSLRRRQLA
jgi:hypothetical protein